MIKIIIVEGYAAKNREDKNTLSNSVTECLKRYKDRKFEIVEIDSRRRRSIKQIRQEIWDCPSGSNVGLFAKSYGCARTEKAIEKNYTSLRHHNKIRVMMVDIHGRAFFNNTNKPYGKRESMYISSEVFDGNDIEFEAVRQVDEWPHGAKLKGRKCWTYIAQNTNHTDIVNHPQTKNTIGTVLEDLFK